MTAVLGILLLLTEWLPQRAATAASLRGIKALPRGEVWASGTRGTVLHTVDGGQNWKVAAVPGGEALDFRAIEASAGFTWLMSAGEGEKSRVYRSTDRGATWSLQFTNPDAKGFWDGIRFWDARHGILLGDPVEGRFTIFTTADAGATWQRQATPPAIAGEGAFAASNTSLAILGKAEAWFGTGGPSGARVFHSKDRGRTWTVAGTPIRNDSATAGIFSLLFVNPRFGVAVGGDYGKPSETAHNVAISADGGFTWTEPRTGLSGYRSAVVFQADEKVLLAVGPSGSDRSADFGHTWRAVDSKSWNAVASALDGKTWACGPDGRLGFWTRP